MPPIARIAAVGLLAAGVAGVAAAQIVYRCGAEGRSYSQQPCAEGRVIGVDDPRGADARRDGQAAAAWHARAAELLAKERQRRESERPRAASLGRSASGDPSFAPVAPSSKGAPKGASRKASTRKGGAARDKGVTSSTASSDTAR